MTLGGTKDISVHQLPTSLFLCLFQCLHLVISGNIPLESTNKNGCHGSSQEYHNHERVHNRKKMHLIIGTSNKVHIPTISPWNITLLPLNLVRIKNLHILATRPTTKGKVRLRLVHRRGPTSTRRNSRSLIQSLKVFSRRDLRPLLQLVINRHGVNIKASNPHSLKLPRLLTISNGEFKVVVQVKLIFFQSSITRGGFESNGISTHCIVEFLAAHQYGKLIQCQVHTILSLHELTQPTEFLPPDFDHAEGSALLIFFGGEVVRGHGLGLSHET
mmetsp:Transcript_18386/g.39718  ORF Transcript_18386/g.39718 Transcript_18386/m.39718 type:complete len:273 (+) Transcript_18386:1113-1931(+)